jgi:hypothetical protein
LWNEERVVVRRLRERARERRRSWTFAFLRRVDSGD